MSENRREFLQSSALGGAGASSAKVLAAYGVAEPSDGKRVASSAGTPFVATPSRRVL